MNRIAIEAPVVPEIMAVLCLGTRLFVVCAVTVGPTVMVAVTMGEAAPVELV